MQRIIVTDLTRFSNQQSVCIAGININTKQCIRPMPYLPISECQRLKILPGTILLGKFSPVSQVIGPHQEDMYHDQLHFEGLCSTDEFRMALDAGLFNSLEEGFEIALAHNQKHIPLGHPLGRSIITIKANPQSIEVIEDSYKPGKIKLHFKDLSGRYYRYIRITDLGFHTYAEEHYKSNDLAKLNAFIKNQSEVYLRIGLSRSWNNGTVDGYWIQINGIYTFPEYHKAIRNYG